MSQPPTAPLQELSDQDEPYPPIDGDTLFSLSLDMLCIADLDGRFRRLNSAFSETLGYSTEELLAHSYFDLLHPDDHERTRAELEQLRRGHPTVHFENRYRCRDGAWKWLCWRAQLIAAGDLVYATAHDVTDRRNAEDALRTTQTTLTSIIDGTRLGTWEWCVQTGATVFNPRWAGMLGYRLDELAPISIETWMQLTHPEDVAEAQVRLQRHFAGATDNYECEIRMRHRDGHWVWVQDTGKVIVWTADGQPLTMVGTHRDITARKQTEEELERRVAARTAELRESRERLRATLEHSPVGMTLMTLDGGWLDINPAFCRFLGYDRDALLAMTSQSVTHPEDRETSAELFRATLEDGVERQELEKRYLHKNGHIVWGLLSASLVRDAAGNPDYFIGQIQDITARKRVSKALTASEHFKRVTLDALETHVAVLNMDGDVIAANRAWRLFMTEHGPECGHASEGMNYLAACERSAAAGRQPAAWMADAVRAVAGGTRVDWFQEYRCQTARGECWFHARIRSFHVNASLYLLIAITDVSALKTAQQAAERAQHLFHDLFDFAPDAIVMTDREGTIRLANRQAECLFGWSRTELVGQPIEVLIPDSARTRHPALRKRFQESPALRPLAGTHRDSLRGLRKDGSEFPAEISLNPMETEEGPMVAAAVRDLTARQEQEADRAARLVAEQASLAKSAFLAIMSHEIRTPLNGIIGSVDLLARSNLDPAQRELTDTIRESAIGLLGVINDILDFSKIEAGRMALEREPISPRQVVETVCGALQALAARRGVRLRMFTDPRLPAGILGDSLRLRQILNNLLSNAIKFSSAEGRRGEVAIRVEPVGGAWLRFTVSDDGIGMTPEVQAKLFSPFVQAETSTTRRFGGTGLGLSIVQSLLELLGGRIEVESASGQGTTFRVILPFEPAPDPMPQCRPDLAGLECLAIAREAGQADDWCRYLEHAGACAESFQDWEAAARRLTPDAAGRQVLVLEAEPKVAEHWRSELPVTPLPALVIVDRGRCLLGPGVVQVDLTALTQEALLTAVGIAAGRLTAELPAPNVDAMNMACSPPDRADAIAQGRLILVAEDNEVNQKVIRRQLNLLGFVCDLADNGQKALLEWRQNDYGALLTDLHMPEMDGYELARTIRAEEGDSRHLPIVALTANAFSETAKLCRDIGMDDFLTKPVVLEQLMATLEKWLPPLSAPAPAPAIPASPGVLAEAPPLDERVLAQLVGEDPDLIAELWSDFSRTAEQCADRMRAAASAADWERVGAVAYELESASFTVGALPLGGCCRCIGQAVRDGDRDAIADWMGRFDQRLAAVQAVIQRKSPGLPVDALTLDERVLIRLIGDDPALMVELFSDFWSSAEQGATRMRDAVAVADWETVRAVAHGLKSAARSIGALPLGDCCQRLEQAGKAGDGAAIVEGMRPFEERLAAVLAEIENKGEPRA
ncbi:hypothetical protein CCR95_03090 [Thiocystis minor]|uniref:PAS domain S-box protein n=1 Tax=Thiocystis minor TaxID=61597 RepID=UPI001912BDB2|nr:PAS domain S-box protein [Thiocystis minor]MBK5963101.1 hypothetical protein [Thiocystis minor]